MYLNKLKPKSTTTLKKRKTKMSLQKWWHFSNIKQKLKEEEIFYMLLMVSLGLTGVLLFSLLVRYLVTYTH